MNDPMTSPWADPERSGSPTLGDADSSVPDTASIAEQAGFSLGPPQLTADARADETADSGTEAASPSDSTWDAEPSSPAEAGFRDANVWGEDETEWDIDESAPVVLGTDEPVSRAGFVLAELQAWEATFRSVTREVEPQPEEPAPEMGAEPEAAAEPEGTAEPEGVAEAEPEMAAEPEAQAEPEGRAEPGIAAEPEPEMAAEPEGAAEPEAQAEPQIAAEPEPEMAAEPEPERETAAEPEPEREVEPEPEDRESRADEAAHPSDEDPSARARALAAAWIPRSAPAASRPASSVFGGPAPWAAPQGSLAAEVDAGGDEEPAVTASGDADGEWTAWVPEGAAEAETAQPKATRSAPAETEAAERGSAETAAPDEPAAAAAAAEDDELGEGFASVEDRWWDEPEAPAADDTASSQAEADEGMTAEATVPDGEPEREPEPETPGSQAAASPPAEQTAAGEPSEAPTPEAATSSPSTDAGPASWASAWSWPDRQEEGPSAQLPRPPEEEEAWPPAPQLSAPGKPAADPAPTPTARSSAPGIMERHLEPTGLRAFSVLSASPEAVPSRQPVPLGAPSDAPTTEPEPTTVDLGLSAGGHAEPPGSPGSLSTTMTPEAQLRAQFRQRAAAAGGGTGGAPAPNALWLLTGEPEQSAGTDEVVRRSAVVNIVLTIFAVIVVVAIVFGFLLLFSEIF